MVAPEPLRRVTLEVTVQDVDPDLLGILTGGVMGNPPAPTFGIHVAYPARRRTLWEWLRRRPRHYAGAVYFPAVSLGDPDADPA